MDFRKNPFFRAFIRQCQNKGAALDIGCSERGAMPVLSENFGFAVGIDMCKDYPVHYSLKTNKKAMRNAGNVEFVQAEAHYLPFRKHVFDTVVCSHVMEHCMNPPAVLRNIREALRPNGNAFLAVPWLSEVYTLNFSHNPLMQWGKLFLIRALDNMRQGERSLLAHLFFTRNKKLRPFMPKSYRASAWYKGKIRLQEYADCFLNGTLCDPHHKHWFTKKEWLQQVQDSGLQIVAQNGIKNVSMIAEKSF